MEDQFAPEVQLEYGERSSLAAIASMPGYAILHRLAKAEAHKFVVHHLNTPEHDEKAILKSFILAKAAAQFYEGLTRRLNEEVYQYTAAPRASDKPVDVTENVLDIGEISQALANVPNLFGEETDI